MTPTDHPYMLTASPITIQTSDIYSFLLPICNHCWVICVGGKTRLVEKKLDYFLINDAENRFDIAFREYHKGQIKLFDFNKLNLTDAPVKEATLYPTLIPNHGSISFRSQFGGKFKFKCYQSYIHNLKAFIKNTGFSNWNRYITYEVAKTRLDALAQYLQSDPLEHSNTRYEATIYSLNLQSAVEHGKNWIEKFRSWSNKQAKLILSEE